MPRTRKQKRIIPAVLAGALGSMAAQAISKRLPVKPVLRAGSSARQTPRKETRQGADVLRSAASSAAVAPVTTGIFMRGSDYAFSAAPVRSGMRGVRISGKQLWFTLCAGTTTGASATRVCLPWSQGVGGSSQYTITFDPDDLITMPNPLTDLCQVFGRYHLAKARVIFTPATATSNGTIVAYAALTDAAQVQLANASGATLLTVMQMSNSCAHPCWSAGGLDVPCDDILRYTYQSVADGSLSAAEERQDHAFGMLVTAGSSLNAGSAYGYFHLEFVVDFYEVVAQANEASLVRLEKRVKMLRRQIDENKKQVLVRDYAKDEEQRPHALFCAVCRDGGLCATVAKSAEREEKKDVVVVDEIPTPPPSARSVDPTVLPVSLKRTTAGPSAGWTLLSR